MTAAEHAEIHALKVAGLSQREIAKRVGLSRPTVAKVLAEPPPVPAHMAPAAAPPTNSPPPPDTAPAIEHARFLVEQARQGLADAQSVGDGQTAQRQTRNLAALLSVLARLEKVERQDEDIIRISRAEVTEVERSLRGRISAILSRPLLCSHCSRELSVQWGTDGLAAPDASDPGAAAKAR